MSHPPPIEQASVFATLRRAALRVHRRRTRGPLPLAQLCLNLRIHVALEEAEVLVAHAEEDECDKREDELDIGMDVPGGKDDARIDDLGVPEHVHRAHGHVVPAMSAVVHDGKRSS